MAVTNYNIGLALESTGDSSEAEVYIKRSLKILEGLGELGSEIYKNIKKARAEVHKKVCEVTPNLTPSSKPVSKRFAKSPYMSKKTPGSKKFVSTTGVLSEVWDAEDIFAAVNTGK